MGRRRLFQHRLQGEQIRDASKAREVPQRHRQRAHQPTVPMQAVKDRRRVRRGEILRHEKQLLVAPNRWSRVLPPQVRVFRHGQQTQVYHQLGKIIVAHGGKAGLATARVLVAGQPRAGDRPARQRRHHERVVVDELEADRPVCGPAHQHVVALQIAVRHALFVQDAHHRQKIVCRPAQQGPVA